MKTKLIFGIIAAIGSLVLYLLDKEALALAFVGIVYGIYERFNGLEKVKEKEDEIQSLKEDNEALRELNRGLRK